MPGRRQGLAGDGADSRQRALGEVGAALAGVLVATRKLRGRDARRGELTFPQYRLVSALTEGELPSSRLAEAGDVTPASATQMIDQLVAAGVVERTRSSEDRRRMLVRLTPKGRRLYRRKQADVEAKWALAFAELDTDDLRGASRALECVRAFFVSV